MTNTGYTLKRPTLKTNYTKILQTVASFNNVDTYPTRSQVREVSGISHNQGYDKALNALLDAKMLEEDRIGQLSIMADGNYLLEDAAVTTAKHYGIW